MMFRSRLKIAAEILERKRYFIFTVSVFTILLFLTIWIPNFPLLKTILLSPRLSILEKLNFLKNSLLTLETSFTPASRILTIVFLLLLSLTLSLTVFYFSRRTDDLSSLGSSLPATIIGIIGVGCASCGSFLLPLLGLTAALGFLPLKGLEFSLASILLLLFSLDRLLTIINQKNLCTFSGHGPGIVKFGEKVTGNPSQPA